MNGHRISLSLPPSLPLTLFAYVKIFSIPPLSCLKLVDDDAGDLPSFVTIIAYRLLISGLGVTLPRLTTLVHPKI